MTELGAPTKVEMNSVFKKRGGNEKNYQNTICEKLGAHNDSFKKCQKIHVTNEAAFKTSFYFENW